MSKKQWGHGYNTGRNEARQEEAFSVPESFYSLFLKFYAMISEPYFFRNNQKLMMIVNQRSNADLLRKETGVSVMHLSFPSERPNALILERIQQAETVLLFLDNDNAGRSAISWWSENIPKVQFYPLPKTRGKDITEAFNNGFSLQWWIDYSQEVLTQKAA